MKKTISILLSFLLVISLFSIGEINLLALSVDDNPLTVSISPSKSSYGVFDNAKITVSIYNSSNKTVENVSAISSFSDIQPVGSGNTLFIENKTIQPGETITYSYSGRIKSSKLNLFQKIIMFFKNLFDRPKSAPNKNYDDGRNKTSSSTNFSIGGYGVKETVTVWFGSLIEPAPVDTEPEVVETTSSSEFRSETSALVREQVSADSFDWERAEKEPYYSCRVIVCGESLNDLDLSGFSPDKVVFKEDFSEAVIQFSTQSAARNCEQQLNASSRVDFAEVDRLVSFELPNEGIASEMQNPTDLSWGEAFIRADQYAHYLEYNNYNDLVTVAVVDSGVDMDHPFLKGRILSNGYDYVNWDSDPDDDYGHGTHVAGIIVDCTNNLNVKIMPVKVMDNHGMQQYFSIVECGIGHASDNGADVINLSIGFNGISKTIDNAIMEAVEKGSVVCVAAGNDATNTADVSPAHIEKALVVGAIDSTGKVASFSNHGVSVDVVAPGVGVNSTIPDGKYFMLDGTSMATPHISAAAAMLRLEHSDYTPEQIEDLIKSYCVDLGDPGRDDYYGNGRLDLYSAIPDCSIKYECNGGTAVANTTVKSTSEIELPETSKAYTVTLNANGGTIASTTRTVDCTLDGWYRNSSYAGIRYAPHDHYMATRDETLYAKWETPQLGNMGTPTKSGNEFLGWFTSATGGTQYTAISSVTSDLTLYAHWKVIAGKITTSSSNDNADGKKLSISWASSGYRYSGSTAILSTGTGTSYPDSDINKPTQGTWKSSTGLAEGAAVFEISNLSNIRTYIKGKGAKITKIEFSAVRANTNNGLAGAATGYLYAVTNTKSNYSYKQKPDGELLIKRENWKRGSTFSYTIEDEAILNNFLGTGSKDYRSFMFYIDNNKDVNYAVISSISITIHYG